MSIINMDYINREMNTLTLKDETIKELRFIKPELTLLIKESLTEIDSLSKSLELIDKYCLCDVLDEINDYLLKNGEYIILYKDNLVQDLSFYIRKENKEKIKKLKDKVKNLSEEKQITLFNKERARQRNLVEELLDILDTLDKDLVKEMMKEYDF